MHAAVRVVEVALREHLHRALSASFDERWYISQRDLFDVDLCDKIDDVLEEVGERAPAGKVVAQLMFGAWASLLGRGATKSDGTSARYIANIWEPALEVAFSSSGVSRKQLRSTAMSLNWARNRISHCEPVVFGFPQPGLGQPGTQVRRSPQLVLEDTRVFAGYLDPAIEAWLRRWTEVQELLADPLVSAALDHIAVEDQVQLQR